ncbi:MAG: phosphatidate cytidylyltransferase [Pseudomonadota bacterium]|jgi:phosphatidate cytidylyltransferase
MRTRVLSAIVALAIVVPVLAWGGPRGVWWLMFPLVLVGMDEYARMALPGLSRPAWAAYVLAGGGVTALAVHAPAWLGACLPVAVMACLVVPMFAEADTVRATERAMRLLFGLVYLPLLAAPLALIRQVAWDGRDVGLPLLALLMVATFGGDTGGYFAGRAFGKTPLFPRVSPKKTVEGLVGGIVLAVVGVGVVNHLAGLGFSLVEVVVLGVLLDLAGVLGDLAESLLKRAFGVKDSGWIMPGHGGVLDRVDSLLFSAPALWLALQLRATFAG